MQQVDSQELNMWSQELNMWLYAVSRLHVLSIGSLGVVCSK